VQDDAQPVVSAPQRARVVAVLALAPQAPFPASLPWPAIGQGSGLAEGPAVSLPIDDPVEFLKKCLDRYDSEVQGYSCIMGKQERVKGKLHPAETVQVFFKERPFSVFMRWLEGAGAARCALYVEGQTGGKMLVLPTLLPWALEKDPKGPEAMQSGRYPITEFGIKIGMERTLDSWKEARANHALHIEYLGVYRVPRAGDRECFKLRRTRYAQPEVDGIMELTTYIDCKTWLQVGSVLLDANQQIIGEYFFRDIHLNPEFAPKQFERSALTP
jgi:hypothetical protein